VTINIEANGTETRTVVVTQYGIRYPDGTINWANVNPDRQEDQVVKTEIKSYYLDPRSRHSAVDVHDLQVRHAQRQQQTHDAPAPLVLVKRTVIVATTEVEHVRSLAAD
jgi:hypothetical protein